jgi:hypothetical protein
MQIMLRLVADNDNDSGDLQNSGVGERWKSSS